jgi:hypothetical protein
MMSEYEGHRAMNIGVWIFLVSGFLTLAIAWLTVCFQIIYAALVNPVNSLEYHWL